MRRLVLLALVVPLAAGCSWFGGGGWSAYPAPTKGLLGSEGPLARSASSDVGRWVRVEHLPASAVPGAKLFAAAGCAACHTYAGDGTKNLNAPPLTSIGTRHLGVAFEIEHLRCPSCVTPGSPMPTFASLGPKRLHELAIFLEDSKGTH